MNEPAQKPKIDWDSSGKRAGKLALILIVLTLVMLVGKGILDLENKTIKETTEYCNAHPDVEMWESEHGTANCTAWRDGTVIAI